MSRKALGGICAGLMLVALAAQPSRASAVVTYPMAWYEVGGGGVQVIDGSYWRESDGFHFLNFAVETSDFRLSASAVGKYDPYLSYGLSVVNHTGSTMGFTFGLFTPIMPITTPNTVYASFSGSTTDVTGNGHQVTPNQPDLDGDGLAEIATSWLDGATNAGVDVGLGYLDPPGGLPGHSNAFGPYESGPKSGPLGTWTSLGTIVGFDLSGSNDVATLNGYLSINPVPEPATVVLLGAGLVGAALLRHRRRRVRG